MFCRSFSGIALFPTEPLVDAAVKYKEREKAPGENCSSAMGQRRKPHNNSERPKEVEHAQMMAETSPTLNFFPQWILDRGTSRDRPCSCLRAARSLSACFPWGVD